LSGRQVSFVTVRKRGGKAFYLLGQQASSRRILKRREEKEEQLSGESFIRGGAYVARIQEGELAFSRDKGGNPIVLTSKDISIPQGLLIDSRVSAIEGLPHLGERILKEKSSQRRERDSATPLADFVL